FGTQVVGAVRAGELVIQPDPATRQIHELQVPQTPAAMRRLCPGASPRGVSGRVRAGGDAGTFLIVLRRTRSPVIERHHPVVLETHRADPDAASVPRPGPAAQSGAVPGPLQAVELVA